MAKRQKPFVVYRGGPLEAIPLPRGPIGWAQFAGWLALLTPMFLWLDQHLAFAAAGSDVSDAIFLCSVGTIAWLVGGLWWMHAHAEAIHIVEIRRQRQYERQKRRREAGREARRPE